MIDVFCANYFCTSARRTATTIFVSGHLLVSVILAQCCQSFVVLLLTFDQCPREANDHSCELRTPAAHAGLCIGNFLRRNLEKLALCRCICHCHIFRHLRESFPQKRRAFGALPARSLWLG